MKRGTSAAAALLCALLCPYAIAEVVGAKERNLAIKYRDGTVERYRVAWTANLTTTQKDEGGSFVPYQGAVETRRCSWTVTSTIDRTVSLSTRLGPTFPLPGLSRTIKGDLQKPDGDFIVSGSVNEYCKAAAGRRDTDIGKARNALIGAFDRLIDADLESLRQEVRSKGDVDTMTVE